MPGIPRENGAAVGCSVPGRLIPGRLVLESIGSGRLVSGRRTPALGIASGVRPVRLETRRVDLAATRMELASMETGPMGIRPADSGVIETIGVDAVGVEAGDDEVFGVAPLGPTELALTP
jgi:hypothetical protein